MEESTSTLDWWCERAWIKFTCLITAFMTVIIMIYWNKWSIELKLMGAISALLPVHVIEEWIFPGGFNYQYNLFLFNSEQPDRYPMCRLSDMITNLVGIFIYVIITVIYAIIEDKGGYVNTGLIMGTIVFSALEVIVHTLFGIKAYFYFRKYGKTTIYGPGSITAYLGFGVFGIILAYVLVDRIKAKLLHSFDWIIMICQIIGMFVFGILLPENIIK